MFKIMFALHLLFAIFAIGPLVHATTTAARGLRHADAAATQASARMTRVYAIASILVIIFGFALMSATSPYTHKEVAKFSETWIWLSLLLWLIAMALALALTAPALSSATKQITDGHSVGTLTARVAASGGAIALIFAAIVFLMVYQPGS
ncbi:MAG: hypothetical protein M3Y77_07960 [Actinomycetota bacterium]|nr:hypothetical protein [Actinomycetota bacterium]